VSKISVNGAIGSDVKEVQGKGEKGVKKGKGGKVGMKKAAAIAAALVVIRSVSASDDASKEGMIHVYYF
jgi:hypothetical protein